MHLWNPPFLQAQCSKLMGKKEENPPPVLLSVHWIPAWEALDRWKPTFTHFGIIAAFTLGPPKCSIHAASPRLTRACAHGVDCFTIADQNIRVIPLRDHRVCLTNTIIKLSVKQHTQKAEWIEEWKKKAHCNGSGSNDGLFIPDH